MLSYIIPLIICNFIVDEYGGVATKLINIE